MDYKTVLVHLDRGEHSAPRLELAFRLAGSFGAHLVGLFALSENGLPSRARLDGGEFVAGLLLAQQAACETRSLEEFHALAAQHPEVSSEWRKASDDAVDALVLNACYADLVILGQRDAYANTDDGMSPGFVDDVLVSVSRPVLLVPYAGKFERVGKRVLVAWNASPEATRAITAALPLLEAADEVQVAVFSENGHAPGHGDVPGADMGLWLARHNANVSVTEHHGGPADIGCRILSHAADFGADLIVMGAYGHSRVREKLLGGATRTLLESMTAPVLMSH